jgi:Cu/Zn superoxide dismutase
MDPNKRTRSRLLVAAELGALAFGVGVLIYLQGAPEPGESSGGESASSSAGAGPQPPAGESHTKPTRSSGPQGRRGGR